MSISKRLVLALGMFRVKVGDAVIERDMEGIVAAARVSFPDPSIEIVTIRSLTDFEKDFASLSDELSESYARGKFRGIASGYFIQEALEGGHGITDIHYDLTGVDNVVAHTHAASELRSLIAHIRTYYPRKVDIHFHSENGLTSLGKNSTEFEGAALPSWLAGRFM